MYDRLLSLSAHFLDQFLQVPNFPNFILATNGQGVQVQRSTEFLKHLQSEERIYSNWQHYSNNAGSSIYQNR